MIRSHDMTTGELGTWLAGIMGLGGAVGVFAGGLIAGKAGDKKTHAGICSYRL